MWVAHRHPARGAPAFTLAVCPPSVFYVYKMCRFSVLLVVSIRLEILCSIHPRYYFMAHGKLQGAGHLIDC